MTRMARMARLLALPTLLLFLATAGGCSARKATAPPRTQEAWKQLFNGTSLAGWQPQVDGLPLGQDPSRVFSVREGTIHAYAASKTTETVPFGFLATTNEYENFALSFEFRWGEKKFPPRATEKRDAGLLFFVHGQSKVWPRCVELQVQEGDTGDIFTVGTVVETTVNPTSIKKGPISSAAYLPADRRGVAHAQGGLGITRIVKLKNTERAGWNTVLLEAHGDEAVYRVNGVVVNRFRALRTVESDGGHRVLSRGKVALQAEGAEVMYRNIKIRSLDPL